MKKINKLITIAMLMGIMNTGLAQEKSGPKQENKNLSTASPTISAVSGSGTIGQIPKWLDSMTLGNSAITEDKFGNIEIGTVAKLSNLTVRGNISVKDFIIFGDGSGLRSAFFNFDPVTMRGNITGPVPLGVAVPLKLSGTNFNKYILEVIHTGTRGGAIAATGSNGVGNTLGGPGMLISGGTSEASIGGTAISANGGASSNGDGGVGVFTTGGGSSTHSGGDGLFAIAGNGVTKGFAGNFVGNVKIDGALNVTGMTSFRIDHPLNPETQYLSHAAIESAETLNVYSGNITVDQNGEATVKLPEWVQTINKDFRYTLTSIGAPGPNLYIAEEVADNHFKIAGGMPGAKISWQITGVRNDAVVKAHPFKAEEEKSQQERGYYLHPELYNQPQEKGIEYARNPELMKQMKETREKTMQEKNQ